MKKKKIISFTISILMIVMLIPSIAMGNENIEKEIDPVTENLEVLTGTEKILYKTEFQGNTYEFVSGISSWEEAKIAAEEAGGHLVTITSLEEQEFLNSTIESNTLNEENYFIGLKKNENEEWQWVSGENFEFSNWSEEQSLVSNDQLEVGSIRGKGDQIGKWNSFENEKITAVTGFIIESELNNTEEVEVEDQLQSFNRAVDDTEKVMNDIINIRNNIYPDGENWDPSGKGFGSARECFAFAKKIHYLLFGNIPQIGNGYTTPGANLNLVERTTDKSANGIRNFLKNAQPGDWIQGTPTSKGANDQHSMIFCWQGERFVVYDANGTGSYNIVSMRELDYGAWARKAWPTLSLYRNTAYPQKNIESKPFRSNIDTPQQDNQINTLYFNLAGWGLNESGIDNMVYSINSGPERNLERGQRGDVSSSHPAYNDNNNLPGFHKNIHISELAYGSNTIIVRAYTPEGVKEIGRVGVLRTAEADPPIISNVEIIDASPAGYTVRCNFWDASGIDRIQFPTWTDHNGQDDLVEDWNINPRVTGTINGDTVTFRVNDADHNYEEGFYNTHIYAFDIYGNMNSGYGAGYKMENKGEAVAKASYNNHEYLLIDDTMTWNDALVKSTELGGHLVTITDEKEQEIVNSLIESGKRNFYWIGGNDIGSEGQWRWSTGEPFSYSNWASGEPNNCEGDENILGVYKGGGWNDLPGRDLGGGFILEKEPIVEDITETVTYGKNKYQRFDIALSWEEAKSYCENLGGRLVVSKSEEQNEVIRKLIENGTKGSYWLGATLIGSNWCGTDGRTLGYSSWGEGQPDNDAGIEHYLSMNKDGRWNDLPKAFYDMGRMGFVCEFENSMLPVTKTEFGNSTYEFYKNTASWKEANRIAKESGGHLVTITSEEEQNFIKETIKNNQIADRNYYIGATDEEEEGNWKWVTGEPMKYTHWMPNEPNNVGGKQHYGVLDVFYNENYLWDDGFISFGNGSEVGFIVEKDNLQLGDVDGSGKIEAYDALLALQIATQKRTGTAKEIKAANVDGNPGVQAFDALRILQFATGKITGFLKN